MIRRTWLAGVIGAATLTAAAMATPYDRCGTFDFRGSRQTACSSCPTMGRRTVWIGQLPAGYAVGDHAASDGQLHPVPKPVHGRKVRAGRDGLGLPQRPCPADFDGSGTLTVDDIFAFLQAWFAGSKRTSGLRPLRGGTTVTDIFMRSWKRWFAGCP